MSKYAVHLMLRFKSEEVDVIDALKVNFQIFLLMSFPCVKIY